MVLASSIDYHHECAFRSKYILLNIVFEWVVWIHNHKGLWSVAANNRVCFKFQLGLVVVRLINYSRVDILYWWMKRENYTLPWTTEVFFPGIYSERYLWPDLSLPNGVVKRCKMDHMGFFMPITPCGKILAGICESKISTDNSYEGIRPSVYSLVLIKWFVGFPKLLSSLFPCVKVMPDWRVIKWRRRADCFISIAKNVFVTLQWQMKRSPYLIDDDDLKYETYEE